jgi:hypothetical protein
VTGVFDRIRPSSLALAVAIAASTSSWVMEAHAQDAVSQPSPAQKETARNLMDVGKTKYEEGDFIGAAEAFEGADKIMGVTVTGLWRGKALDKLGRLVDARDVLLAVARIPAGDNEPAVLSDARNEAAELQLEVAGRIPEVTFLVTGLQAPAEPSVTVDGEAVPLSTLELPQKVDPGRHKIVATAPGHFDLSVEVEVRDGESQKVSLVFRANGEPIVPPPPKPPPGPVQPPANTGLSGLAVTAIVAGSIGGASLLVGAITGGLSLSRASDAKSNCVDGLCPAEDESARDSSVTLAHVSTATFVVGGVGAAVAGVALIMELTGDEPQTGALVPLLGPGFVGVSGRF